MAAADFRDLFVEDRESMSIRWALGSSDIVRYGRRTGAGERHRGRGGRSTFQAIDGLPSGRAGEAIASMPGDEGWLEDEPRRAISYVETAARGVLREVAARTIEADIQIFRQRIHHEGPWGESGDERKGIRIVIRGELEGSSPIERRLADHTAERLAVRRPAADVGIDLGTSLLATREARARVDGVFPAIFAARGCGALAHEIGHLLEEDLSGHRRIPALSPGRRVADPKVTLRDDPLACEGRGTYKIDDEGSLPRRRTLIGEGVVLDRLSSLSSGDVRGSEDGGGHGRRASYRDLPHARMACTFFSAGGDEAGHVLADTARGVFLRSLRAGDIDPTSGTLTLIIEEGFLIENGRLTRPLGEGLIVAQASELLEAIDAVCSDLELDHGAGDCVKLDQAMPVAVGMPTMRTRMVRVITS